MGFFKRNKKENAEPVIDTAETAADEDANERKVTKEEFMAAENLIAATEEKPFDGDADTEEQPTESDDESDIATDEETAAEEDNNAAGPETDTGAEPDEETNEQSETEAEKPAEDESDQTESAAQEQEQEQEPTEKQTVIKLRDIKEYISKHKKGCGIAGISLGAVFCILLGIFIYGCMTVPTDRMGRNIYVENINISNMTFDEALETLENAELLTAQDITVTCNASSYNISGVDIGLAPRLEDTVDKAMRYGKTKYRLINGLANSLQIFFKHTVVPNANVDETVLREKLSDFGKQIYGELVEHQLDIADDVVICTPGHSGFDNNTDEAYEEVMNAINHDEKFKNIPVTLKLGAPYTLTVEDFDNYVYLDYVDAYYSLENNVITVVPEIYGRVINKEEAAELLTQLYEGGEVITIPYEHTYPQVTAEQLQSKLFNATIASYTTSYGTSSANRCANIANAASRINGKILLPGDVFSFNDAVGPRSVANGFYTAKEYVNGETVDGIGGGTCQVSSTLYNAVIYSDMSIVTRTNHMFPVGYCPLGQDATVADSGVDFKFVNSMDYPVKIAASTGGYRITVSIIGTQRDDPRTVRIQNTSSMDNSGGTRVRTTRYVYNSAGTLISSDQLPSSYYKPHPTEG